MRCLAITGSDSAFGSGDDVKAIMDDHREGVRAFLEKRPPRWIGR